MAIKNPKDYEIVGLLGNRQGTLRKTTGQYFMTSDKGKHLPGVSGGQWSIRKKGKL